MLDRELEYQRFQEYLANKRANFAPSFGATILASTVALGVVEVSQPNTEFRNNTFDDIYSPSLGAIALENQLGPRPTLDILTPKTAARGRAEELALAA